jgi:hypothetical protein
MEGLPLEVVFGVLTPAGLLGLAVWMILTGRLVPGRIHDSVVQERDKWRDVATATMSQNLQLLETARTVNAVMKALPPAGQLEGDHQ